MTPHVSKILFRRMDDATLSKYYTHKKVIDEQFFFTVFLLGIVGMMDNVNTAFNKVSS